MLMAFYLLLELDYIALDTVYAVLWIQGVNVVGL
jgi:hypothetical protein